MGGFSNIGKILTAAQNNLGSGQFAKADLRDSIKRTEVIDRELRDTFDPLNAAAAGTATDRARRRTANLASFAANTRQTSRPTNLREALAEATRRAGIRSQIVRQGEPAAQQQGLRNRVQIARRGLGRTGRFQQAIGTAANINEGVNVGVANADAISSASRADLFGGLAGATAATLANPESRQRIGSFFGGLFGGGGLDPAVTQNPAFGIGPVLGG